MKNSKENQNVIVLILFYGKILNEGGCYNRANVKRWICRLPGEDMFKFKLLMFPISKSLHYFLVLMNAKKKSFDVMTAILLMKINHFTQREFADS